jgi:hypothetical protein
MRAKRLRDQLNRLSDPDYFRSPWGEEGGLTIPKNAKVNPGRRCGGGGAPGARAAAAPVYF